MFSIWKFLQRGWLPFIVSHWRSLKSRLTLFTLAIFLASVWSLALYASRILRSDMERVLGEQQYATVSLVAEQVNAELDERLQALGRIAADISPAMLNQPALLQAELEQRLHFQNMFNGGISVAGRDGRVIADAPSSSGRLGIHDLDRADIAAVLSSGKAMIGRPVIGTLRPSPTLVMAAPIRAADGQVHGVLVGEIRLDGANFIDKIMDSRHGTNGGYLLIAPQHRLFVTGSDKSRIMQPIPAPGVNPLFDRYMQGYVGHGVSRSSRGIEELTAVKGIPVAGWYMGLAIPTAEVFAPIRAMLHRMLLATLLLTALAGGLTWCMISWMLRRQLSPILAAARTLADLPDINQAAPPLEVAREDEVGQLIGNFNRVLHTLNQREAFLKQVLDTSSAAIFLLDLEGRIKLANRRMAEMFRCSVEDLLGKEYVALLSPDERESGRRNMLALLNSSIKQVELDRLYWCFDNTSLWGHLTGKRFYDANGEERGLIGVIADVTERKQMEDQVCQLAFYDALTRLPNRRLLADRLNQVMASSKRSGKYGALMVLDLDNFKSLNDTHGHLVGDLLLIEVAGRLNAGVRGTDTVARFGGDEFVVALSNLSADMAEAVVLAGLIAEEIRSALAAPYLLTSHREGETATTIEHRCSASIGVVLFAGDAYNQDELLKWADTAMYQAKEAGHNRVKFHAFPAASQN